MAWRYWWSLSAKFPDLSQIQVVYIEVVLVVESVLSALNLDVVAIDLANLLEKVDELRLGDFALDSTTLSVRDEHALNLLCFVRLGSGDRT